MSRIIAATIALLSIAQLGSFQWNNPNGDGNTHIYVSNTNVSYGTAHPADVIHTLLDGCHDDGTCLQSWTVPSDFYTGNSYTPGDVKVEIQDGQYEIWAKNGLVEALSSVTELFQSSQWISYREPSDCGGDKGCTRQPARSVQQWYGPDSINLQVRDPEGGLKDFIHIVIVPEKDDTDLGLCDLLFDLGAEAAGLVTDHLGAGFVLGKLLCGS